MEQKKNELKIELTPEIAAGHYANLAFITHSPSEVFLDFIAMAPNMPQAKVQSRIIMTPDNAKNLLHALADNIHRYEATFGEIKTPRPINHNQPGEIPNPFMNGQNGLAN